MIDTTALPRALQATRSVALRSLCIALATTPALSIAAETTTSALEEIVVTARKREESLQETPIAISAFSAAALERQAIQSTVDLDQVSPNLQFASYGPLTGNNAPE